MVGVKAFTRREGNSFRAGGRLGRTGRGLRVMVRRFERKKKKESVRQWRETKESSAWILDVSFSFRPLSSGHPLSRGSFLGGRTRAEGKARYKWPALIRPVSFARKKEKRSSPVFPRRNERYGKRCEMKERSLSEGRDTLIQALLRRRRV